MNASQTKQKYSNEIEDRVRGITNQGEADHVASLLSQIEDYVCGDIPLNCLSGCCQKLVKGDARAYMEADATVRKHYLTVLHYLHWDVPSNKVWKMQKAYRNVEDAERQTREARRELEDLKNQMRVWIS